MSEKFNALESMMGMEKEAFLSSIAKSMAKNKDLLQGSLAAAGITSLAGMGISALLSKIQNDVRRKAIIEDLYMNDPLISQAPKDEVLQYYATIYNLAPKVSLEKNVVKELLQNFIKFGRVDVNTAKTLVDTEKGMMDVQTKNSKKLSNSASMPMNMLRFGMMG